MRTPAQRAAATSTRLTAEAQGQIGRQLRRAYDEMLAEPLPDKFTKLLEELAKTCAAPANQATCCAPTSSKNGSTLKEVSN